MKSRISGQQEILLGRSRCLQLHQRTIQKFMMKQSSMLKQHQEHNSGSHHQRDMSARSGENDTLDETEESSVGTSYTWQPLAASGTRSLGKEVPKPLSINTTKKDMSKPCTLRHKKAEWGLGTPTAQAAQGTGKGHQGGGGILCTCSQIPEAGTPSPQGEQGELYKKKQQIN